MKREESIKKPELYNSGFFMDWGRLRKRKIKHVKTNAAADVAEACQPRAILSVRPASDEDSVRALLSKRISDQF